MRPRAPIMTVVKSLPSGLDGCITRPISPPLRKSPLNTNGWRLIRRTYPVRKTHTCPTPPPDLKSNRGNPDKSSPNNKRRNTRRGTSKRMICGCAFTLQSTHRYPHSNYMHHEHETTMRRDRITSLTNRDPRIDLTWSYPSIAPSLRPSMYPSILMSIKQTTPKSRLQPTSRWLCPLLDT